MATLHKEFNEFYDKIRLTEKRKKDLLNSRKSLRKKIKDWFAENQPDKLQPTFRGQGSFEMNTTINPIVIHIDDKEIRKYDLDDGVYFVEKEGENNREKIATWHDWVYKAVNTHTIKETQQKKACIRVIFSDGHHIDLPIYYKDGNTPELAHRSKDWLDSNPVEFTDWFHKKANKQIIRLVRYIKAWKDFKHTNKDNTGNTHLKLPSGFALTILIVNNYVEKQHDDTAFRETVRKMYKSLSAPYGFKCLRPTTPKGEDVFAEYSKTRKDDFLIALHSLLDACDKAKDEKNFKKASEYLIEKQFDVRFPKGADTDEKDQKKSMSDTINKSYIKPKPHAD